MGREGVAAKASGQRGTGAASRTCPERDRTEESGSRGPAHPGTMGVPGGPEPTIRGRGTYRPLVFSPATYSSYLRTYGGCDEFGWAPDSDCSSDQMSPTPRARPFRRRSHAVRIAPDVAPDAGLWERFPRDTCGRWHLQVSPSGGASTGGIASEDAAPDPGRPRGTSAGPIREPLEALLSARREDGSPKHFPYAGSPAGGTVLVAVHGLAGWQRARRWRLRAVRPTGRPATEDDSAVADRTVARSQCRCPHPACRRSESQRSVRTLALPHRGRARPGACGVLARRRKGRPAVSGSADRRRSLEYAPTAQPWPRARSRLRLMLWL